MTDPQFKVDENLPVEITELLRDAGYDALSIHDQQMVLTLGPTIPARLQCRQSLLERLFSKNYDNLSYPLFGIGSFFHFEVGRSEEEGSSEPTNLAS